MGRPFLFQDAQQNDGNRGDAQLEKNCTESRPRLREKVARCWRQKGRLSNSVCFSLLIFREHASRGLQNPSTEDAARDGCAQPAIGDPGSKGRRVAWKTSFGLGRTRQTTTVAFPGGSPTASTPSLRAWTERCGSTGRALHTDTSRQLEGKGHDYLDARAAVRRDRGSGQGRGGATHAGLAAHPGAASLGAHSATSRRRRGQAGRVLRAPACRPTRDLAQRRPRGP